MTHVQVESVPRDLSDEGRSFTPAPQVTRVTEKTRTDCPRLGSDLRLPTWGLGYKTPFDTEE